MRRAAPSPASGRAISSGRTPTWKKSRPSEELAALDPDLQAALFENPPDRPFSCTLVFAPFDGPDYAAALALAKASGDYLETGTGDALRHRARFTPDQVLALRDLWRMVGRFDDERGAHRRPARAVRA